MILCQRYYHTKTAGVAGVWYTTSRCALGFQFGVPMRTTPSTVTVLNSAPVVSEIGVADRTGSGVTVIASALRASGGQIFLDGFTGATAGKTAITGTDGVLGFSAEL